MIKHKTCVICEKTKRTTQFYKRKDMKDGREGRCKDCNKAASAKRYKANHIPSFLRKVLDEQANSQKETRVEIDPVRSPESESLPYTRQISCTGSPLTDPLCALAI